MMASIICGDATIPSSPLPHDLLHCFKCVYQFEALGVYGALYLRVTPFPCIAQDEAWGEQTKEKEGA